MEHQKQIPNLAQNHQITMDEVKDFFNQFFNTDSFPARWHCGKWSEFHGWLYIISDIAIWAAYFTIPFLLIHFIRRKKDVPFPKIFWLFGGFILACGATHLIDAIIFWIPIYRVSALVRLFTAVISWATIYALYKVLPNAFSLKTPAELEKQVSERTDELHRSVLKMRFLADAMPQMVWTAKPDGTRDYFNEPTLKFTGRTIENLLGWKWTGIIHPDDRELTEKRWSESLNNGTGFEIENRLLAADGKYYWHLTRALPHKDENDNILIWVGTATQIEHHKRAAEILEQKVAERTEQLREVNAELSQSNADLEHFAAVASHDLQAPLRTITNYLDLILEKNRDKVDEQTTNYINKTINASMRMRNLIDKLLSFSQINSAHVILDDLDLNEVMGSVLANIEDLKEKKNAAINYGQLPTVYGDEVQIGQLLQNLITNAINYNSSDIPVVTVEAEENTKEHIIRVSDNGVGIKEEYLSKIFEVFTRLQADVQGSGLGLAICKRIIDKHNGKIWVESQEGKGTSFFFTLPKKGK